jgi:probable HAF family extracellular repeat protein
MKTFFCKTAFAFMGLIVAALLASSPAHAGYTITDLGAGGIVQDINNAGQVVGYYLNSDYSSNAFIYSGGTLTNLGAFGNFAATATGINNNGQVVISTHDVFNGTAEQHANNWSYIYDSTSGTTKTIGQFVNGGQAYDINNAGQVSGAFTVGTVNHAFLYQNGDANVTDIGTWGNQTLPSSSVYINASGQVAGVAYTTTLSNQQINSAYISDLNGQNAVNIGNLGSTDSGLTVYGLNDLGQVVGRSRTADGILHYYFYDGNMLDMSTVFPDAKTVYARGLNNNGQVVGYYIDANNVRHAYLYENGNITDFWGQVSNADGWTLSSVTGINDNGWIIGSASIDGVSHAILLTPDAAPVPIPAAAWLLGSGLIGLVGYRRRFSKV